MTGRGKGKRKLKNFIEETVAVLKSNGKKPSDVEWVGTPSRFEDDDDKSGAMTWEEFKEISKDVEYDSGFGGHEINLDLVVVGVGAWWLERSEYDGSEGWDFKTLPMKPKDAKPLTTVLSWGGIRMQKRRRRKAENED